MLEKIKHYLRAEDDEERELQELIEKSKDYLNSLAGVELDFNLNALANSLLRDRCRYIYNNASEYFEENFKNEILRLQLQEACKEISEKNE